MSAARKKTKSQPSRAAAPQKQNPVVVVGSVAFDEISTPLGDHARVLGGSATYAAFATSRFAPAQLIGVVGNDFDSQLRRLKSRNIDLSGLQVDASGPTFFWSGAYHDNFTDRTTRKTELNVFANFDPVIPEEQQRAKFVLLGNIQPSLQIRVLDQMRGKPFVAADTMQLWLDIARPDLLKLLKRVDLFVLNEEEAGQLTGHRDPLKAAPKLHALGPKIVIIKKGPHGSVLFHPKGYFTLPAYPISDLRDPTGAGDSYLGALMGRLAELGRTDINALRSAIAYATVTASFTVQSLGPDSLEKATRAQINRRYEQLRGFTQFA